MNSIYRLARFLVHPVVLHFAAPVITLRSEKGSELTASDIDPNFLAVRDVIIDKYEDVSQALHGFVVGDVLRRDGGAWVKASSASVPASAWEAVVSEVGGTGAFTVIRSGALTLTAHGFSIGATVWLGSGGAMTTTKPAIAEKVGIAIDTNTIFLMRGGASSVSAADVGLGDFAGYTPNTLPLSAAATSALNGKQNEITGAATSIVSSNLTASRAVVSDGSGKVSVSNVTATEIGHLSGVTSNIQTQLNGRASDSEVVKLTGDQTVAGVKTFSSSPVVPTPTAGDNTTKAATTAFVTAAIANMPSEGVYDTKTADYTIVSADAGKTIALAGTVNDHRTFTIAIASGFANFARLTVANLINVGGGATTRKLTVSCNAADTFNGQTGFTSFVLNPGEIIHLRRETSTSWVMR